MSKWQKNDVFKKTLLIKKSKILTLISKIYVIIPALNEENAIVKVINHLPKELIQEIIVVNNGSTDKTAYNAQNAGATVISEPIKGYGKACLAGISYLKNKILPQDIIVFLDGDFSDYPQQLNEIIAPIINQNKDMVIGSRVLGNAAKNALMPVQKFGNALSTILIKIIYGYTFTDLGPFRAITYKAFNTLKMKDQNYGWTVEMQVKAAKLKLKCTEVPVDYKVRIGQSKVSGTIKGSILAGTKILYTIFKNI